MEAIWLIFFKALWCGMAALGFSILFNAPARALPAGWWCGFLAGFAKFSLLQPPVGGGMVIASFAGAVLVGLVSIPLAHRQHVTPMIFAIPAVIPLVPGSFAYRTMLGLMKLAGPIGDTYSAVLNETVHNAVTTLFIILAISIGVAVPMHALRKESVKNLRLNKKPH